MALESKKINKETILSFIVFPLIVGIILSLFNQNNFIATMRHQFEYKIEKNQTQYNDKINAIESYITVITLINNTNKMQNNIVISVDSPNRLISTYPSMELINLENNETYLKLSSIIYNDQEYKIFINHKEPIQESDIKIKLEEGKAKLKNDNLLFLLLSVLIVLLFLEIIWIRNILLKNRKIKKVCYEPIDFNKNRKEIIKLGSYIELKIGYKPIKLEFIEILNPRIPEENKNSYIFSREDKTIKFRVISEDSRYIYINVNSGDKDNIKILDESNFILALKENILLHNKYIYLIDDDFKNYDEPNLKLYKLHVSHLNVNDETIELTIDELIVKNNYFFNR